MNLLDTFFNVVDFLVARFPSGIPQAALNAVRPALVDVLGSLIQDGNLRISAKRRLELQEKRDAGLM
ncbi:MAG: hypothetical protein C4333_06135 [Meiothermus sp.]